MSDSLLKMIAAFAISIVLLCGCNSSQGIGQAYDIGMISYTNYSLQPHLATGNDTTFFAITNQETFDKTFLSSNVQSTKPAFQGQTAVAVYMPPGSEAKIEKATISGQFMNIYVSTCGQENPGCGNRLSLATTPKSGNVKKVRFFVNGFEKKIVNIR